MKIKVRTLIFIIIAVISLLVLGFGAFNNQHDFANNEQGKELDDSEESAVTESDQNEDDSSN